MRGWIFILAWALAACSEGGDEPGFVAGAASDVFSVVQTPIEDVGLKRAPIPEKLQQIVEFPYALERPVRCERLRAEIAELDALLGKDVDATMPWNQREATYGEEGAGAVRDYGVGVVKSQVDVVPFRGVVRRISGADQHARAVARAYQAGKLRRAYLKGLLQTCVSTRDTFTPIPEDDGVCRER